MIFSFAFYQWVSFSKSSKLFWNAETQSKKVIKEIVNLADKNEWDED